jgi:hypothetical protein
MLQDFPNQKKIDECLNRIRVLDREIEDNKKTIKKLRKMSGKVPEEEFVNFCKIDAGDCPKRFLTNLLTHFYPKGMLKELSLTGKHGKVKLCCYIVDFLIEKCMAMYPEMKAKQIRKTISYIIFQEKMKTKKENDKRQLCETAHLLGDNVINVCKIKSGNSVGCFVRNILRELFPSCILIEFSLSGR